MKKRKIWIGILLLVLALAVSVLLGFQGDRWVYAQSDHEKTETEEARFYTDGKDAFGFLDCEIIDNRVMVMGVDPQFVVSAKDTEFSMLRIVFGEPVARDTVLQIYYVLPGGGFSEEHSLWVTIPSGTEDLRIPVMKTVYGLLRFDFAADVLLDGIYGMWEVQRIIPYAPNTMRIILLAGEAFAMLLVCFLIWKRGNRTIQETGDDGIRKKAFGTILFCNLLLSLTVVFFQPFFAAFEMTKGFLSVGAWSLHLLAALGIALVLSGLMMLLPAGAGRVAAAVSLGCGIALVAQYGLLNEGRFMQMNTNWPVKVENAYLVAAILIITVVTVIYYRKGNTKRIQAGMCIIAWALIMAQVLSLSAVCVADPQRVEEKTEIPGLVVIQREETEVPEEAEAPVELDFGKLMELSFQRGIPYPFKDSIQK